MKLTLYILIFFLLCPIVFSAAPGFITEQSEGTLSIVYPKFEYYPETAENVLHFHVYNSSGDVQDNNTAQCYLHMYNETNHVIKNPVVDFDPPLDWEQNFTLPMGIYSFVVGCNTSNEGGVFSAGIEVLHDSRIKRFENVQFTSFSIIFGLGVLVSILSYLVVAKLDEEHIVIKIITILWSIIMCTILIPKSLLDAVNGVNTNTASIFFSGSMWYVTVLITYILIFIIYKLFTSTDIIVRFIEKLKR